MALEQHVFPASKIGLVGDVPASLSELQCSYSSTVITTTSTPGVFEGRHDPPSCRHWPSGATLRPEPVPRIHQAHHGFIPNEADQVGCKLGNQIVVGHVRPDGWAQVLNFWTGQKGLLPVAKLDVGEEFSRSVV
ncbi:hypothetical protein BDK51DRAFT_31968 [Blyttiomyces helicus]|uniref:SH3 domain-containing protein n=1 Tax=Blyttiomyces helicus TaxID=388810 RepID=A0A4P9W4S5_9FUNG|nr:hypothetical protein BDK51DRAFT_31968 [Blyttiomyces helicus]|eukprot:RKO87214.1 hypothetical protein BDK51DRAFT_31968 [Blyttiomyces helicus]